MTVEEQRWERLYEAARELLGDEEAATLMDQLRRWQELATRSDVAAVRSDIRADFVALRADLDTLGAELRGEMVGLRGDVRAELHQGLRSSFVNLALLVVPTIIASTGLAFAAARVA